MKSSQRDFIFEKRSRIFVNLELKF